MNGLEIYNEILQNTHNLKGTWEVTEENYLKVDGMTNGSIVLFDQTVGALGDFILEWTAEQKGGSYIHSNLCPSLRYTPEDAGIEGGGDNYAVLVYLCNYGGNTGTFNLRTEGGTKSEVNAHASLNIDTVYSFRFERLNGVYKLYQDGVLINTATDITKQKLYLGWYLWYGGSTNSSYQTNFILREYKLTKVDTKSYLDTIGLTTLWSKIKSLFATKAELNTKANDSDVVHKSGNETIKGDKGFHGTVYGTSSNGLWFRHLNGTTSDNLNGDLYLNYNSPNRPIYFGNAGYGIYNNGANYSGTAQRAIEDSDGNQINTTYLKDSNITNYKFKCAGGWWNFLGYENNGYNNISVNGAGDTIGSTDWSSRPNDGWGQLISFTSNNNELNHSLHLWWGFNYRNIFFRTYYSGSWSSWKEILTGSMGALDVGSTVLATTNIALGYGATTAGSNLKFAGLDTDGGILNLNNNIGATGTWIKVSGNSGNNNGFGLYRRIA